MNWETESHNGSKSGNFLICQIIGNLLDIQQFVLSSEPNSRIAGKDVFTISVIFIIIILLLYHCIFFLYIILVNHFVTLCYGK